MQRHGYDIYKENHPVTPEQVVNVFDLVGYLGVAKTFHSKYITTLQKEEKPTKELSQEEKESTIKVILKEE